MQAKMSGPDGEVGLNNKNPRRNIMARGYGRSSDFEDRFERFAGGASRNIVRIAIVIVVLLVLVNSVATIGAGERGVVFSKFGGVQDTVLDEGWRFKVPFVQDIIPIDVKIQKSETAASASSKDLQMVSSTIAVNYHVNPNAANKVYQDVGLSYKERIIDPAVQESVKAATAQFTAEELITRRGEVSIQIKEMLSQRLLAHNIVVDEFNIVDFSFSAVFNEAIEAKQTAEQSALKAQRDLERVKIEAEQQITAARAEAEGQRLQRETISEEILQLRAIEKWDGHLPQVTSGGTPFIDLKAMRGGA
ncbi:MAG: prohibitin family protein [Bryobacterales bacterium]|nr:prohibitin family protein [Bryobacterales bacterium]